MVHVRYLGTIIFIMLLSSIVAESGVSVIYQSSIGYDPTTDSIGILHETKVDGHKNSLSSNLITANEHVGKLVTHDAHAFSKDTSSNMLSITSAHSNTEMETSIRHSLNNRTLPFRSRPLIPTTNQTNISLVDQDNWASYTYVGSDVTEVKGSWTVPTTHGTLGEEMSTWVGIGGWASNLIQAGTSWSWLTGYHAWIEFMYDPEDSRCNSVWNCNEHDIFSVSARDSIFVEITYHGSNSWNINVQDFTNNQNFQQTFTFTSSYDTAEWVVAETPCTSNCSGSNPVFAPLSPFDAFEMVNCYATDNGAQKMVGGWPTSSLIVTIIGSSSSPTTYVFRLSSPYGLDTVPVVYKTSIPTITAYGLSYPSSSSSSGQTLITDQGATIHGYLDVSNPTSIGLPMFLGMSIQNPSCSNSECTDPTDDQMITMSSNAVTWQSRVFVIGRSVSTGTYTYAIAIWTDTPPPNGPGVQIATTGWVNSVTINTLLSNNANCSPLSGVAPLRVNCDSNPTGGTAAYTYSWIFGDGGTSGSSNPSHTYTTQGSFSVSLTINDAAGETSSASFTIAVSLPFQFSIRTPGTQTTSQTGSATFSFTVTTTSGGPQSVTLSLSNPPSGISTPTWSPSATITPSTSGTSVQLTITPSCSTTAQSYSTLQISGSGGGASASSSSFTLTVTTSSSCQPFDFSMSNSGGITVTQGGSGTNTITVTLSSGVTQSVSLSCTAGLPNGATCSNFNPQSNNPTFSSTLTVSTSSSTSAGSSTITVTGTGGGKTHTTQFTLTVNAVPTVQITVTSSPTGSGFVTVNGTAIATPHSYTWAVGSAHTLAANSPVGCGSGCRYVWTSWSDSGGQSHSINAPSSTTTYTASYVTQYYLTVTSPYGSPSPSSNWFNVGSISASVSSPVSGGTGTRYVCTGWTGSGSVPSSGSSCSTSFTINAPSSITWNWQTQFSLTVNGGNGIQPSVASQTGDNFWNAGTSLTVSSNGIYGRSGGSGTRVSSWNIVGGANANVATIGTVTTAAITMSAAHTVNFNPVTQYQVTLDTGAKDALSSLTSPTISGDNYWYDSGTPVTLTIHGVFGRSGSTGTRVTGYSINVGSNNPVSTTGTVSVLNALSITLGEAITTTTVTQYQLTFATLPVAAGTATATTSPPIAGDTGWYDFGTSVSILAKSNPGYSFSSWTGTGASGSCSGSCSSVTMNGPITEVANFLTSTSISLSVSTSTVPIGSSVGLSGSIAPNPSAVQVTLSFSRDSGSTWAPLIIITTDSTGHYSTSWQPLYPGPYLLMASWSGNSQFASSTSTSASLTVTGTVSPTPTLVLSAPSTATTGQNVRLTLTTFNPNSAPLNANIAIQITGPGNYVILDVVPVKALTGESITYYDWTVPNQAGAYSVTVGYFPNSGTYDSATIQVTAMAPPMNSD